ncbi:MAG TPA: hypothetical protein VKB35_13880 [Ktedonobacteraceae bacterium]|nr:hypothetical protein [Ktedonobacteraceae bacterium]
MEAIQLNGAARMHRYACQGLNVNPNPPRVGEVTTLALALKNTGPGAITINRIQFMVAGFGMGLGWEQLPPIEQLTLRADPQHVEDVAVQWTPTKGGHRCVRVTIESDVLPQPLTIGRNLEVIESTADRRTWHVPFRLGNPENEGMPVTLELGGDDAGGVDAMVLINGRPVGRGRAVWLNAREEVEARLVLHARTEEAISALKTVEAHIQGRFIDGIQVEVYRPAYSSGRPVMEPDLEMRSAAESVNEPAAILAR